MGGCLGRGPSLTGADCCCGAAGPPVLYMLALPELTLKWPRLTADIFHQEAKNDNFFVGGLHSRTLAQMDAITALMKQNLNVQLLVSPEKARDACLVAKLQMSDG